MNVIMRSNIYWEFKVLYLIPGLKKGASPIKFLVRWFCKRSGHNGKLQIQYKKGDRVSINYGDFGEN